MVEGCEAQVEEYFSPSLMFVSLGMVQMRAKVLDNGGLIPAEKDIWTMPYDRLEGQFRGGGWACGGIKILRCAQDDREARDIELSCAFEPCLIFSIPE